MIVFGRRRTNYNKRDFPELNILLTVDRFKNKVVDKSMF